MMCSPACWQWWSLLETIISQATTKLSKEMPSFEEQNEDLGLRILNIRMKVFLKSLILGRPRASSCGGLCVRIVFEPHSISSFKPHNGSRPHWKHIRSTRDL